MSQRYIGSRHSHPRKKNSRVEVERLNWGRDRKERERKKERKMRKKRPREEKGETLMQGS